MSLLAKSILLSYSKSKDKVTVEEVMKSNSHSIQNNENDDCHSTDSDNAYIIHPVSLKNKNNYEKSYDIKARRSSKFNISGATRAYHSPYIAEQKPFLSLKISNQIATPNCTNEPSNCKTENASGRSSRDQNESKVPIDFKRREAQINLIKEALQLNLSRQSSLRDNKVIETLIKSFGKDKSSERNSLDINGFKQNLLSCLTYTRVAVKPDNESK